MCTYQSIDRCRGQSRPARRPTIHRRPLLPIVWAPPQDRYWRSIEQSVACCCVAFRASIRLGSAGAPAGPSIPIELAARARIRFFITLQHLGQNSAAHRSMQNRAFATQAFQRREPTDSHRSKNWQSPAQVHCDRRSTLPKQSQSTHEYPASESSSAVVRAHRSSASTQWRCC